MTTDGDTYMTKDGPRRKRRTIDDDMLRELWPTGITDRDLARKMGHGRGVLRRRAENIGLPPRSVARMRALVARHDHEAGA